MFKETLTFGEDGGSPFEVVVVKSVGARAGAEVDAIDLNGVRHGGEGGTYIGSLTLDDDEYFNYLWVRCGTRVDNFELRTNKGRSFGRFKDGHGGSEHTYDNIRILTIGGRSGARLDQLRVTMIRGSASWMSDNLKMIGNKRLDQICIPGSHDSGMSCSHNGTFGVGSDNTQTQHLDILGQLRAGCRYLDIRPIVGSGTFWTGHYTGRMGARGLSMDDVIDQVNSFTDSNPELVILRLKNDKDTDTDNYPSFTSTQWDGLLSRLEGLKNLYRSDNNNLTGATINSFIGSDKAAVVVIVPRDVSLGARRRKGFFDEDDLKTTGEYTNTLDLDKMIGDQLQKMADNRNTYFKMSWELTQDTKQAVMTSPIVEGIIGALGMGLAPKPPSILDMAARANAELERRLLPQINKSTGSFPRILSIDAVGTNVDIGGVALNINRLICQT